MPTTRDKGATERRHVAQASRLPAPPTRESALDHALAKVRACIAHLETNGHVPTHIEAGRGGTMPIVWIEPRAGVARLKRQGAAHYRHEGFPGGKSYTWQAEIHGCRVQWIEIVMGGAAPC
jgi:hypothetical protein